MILYLGDTSLNTAAAYLAGIMTHFKLPFTYRASDERTVAADLVGEPRLFILSDYPSAMLSDDAQHRIIEAVRHGAGLLMLGGWESYCGQGGNWAGTPIAEVLPVNISTSDDRINCPQPALARPASEHEITANLPWHTPPCIGGFNRLTAKPDAQIVLEVERYTVSVDAAHEQPSFRVLAKDPLLVVGSLGAGRTAALATDVAPHWVGGFVDWGSGRVHARGENSIDIEVGSDYALLFYQLLNWTGRLNSA